MDEAEVWKPSICEKERYPRGKKERSLLQRDEVKENKLKAASKHTSTSIGKANDGRETRGNTKRNNVGRKK